MPGRYPDVVAAPSSHAVPADMMHGLHDFLAKQSDKTVLLNTLGLHNLFGLEGHLAALIDHTVVIGIDTEAWTMNTDEMTEIGIAVYEREDMIKLGHRNIDNWRPVYQESRIHLGPFGEAFLKNITFHHLRIVETAHLRTNASWMKGPEGNRFGHSRFVTFAEARSILDSLFDVPIPAATVAKYQELKGCKKPVILIGHAIVHDESNFKKIGLSYDPMKHGTVVRKIDTQILARSTRTWIDPKAPGNTVGLDTLTRTLGFEHEDAHTACNDVARTVIAAIQMVLPAECREGNEKSMQSVAWEIEQHSRNALTPTWGSKFCCTRCGARDHQDEGGECCTVAVCCDACVQYDCTPRKTTAGENSLNTDTDVEQNHSTTHIEAYCIHVARHKAWVRRRDNAIRKGNPLPPTPSSIYHPASVPVVAEESVMERSPSMSYRPGHVHLNGGPVLPTSRSPSFFTTGTELADTGAVATSRVHDNVARIVTLQSAGRGRGCGKDARRIGATQGDERTDYVAKGGA